MKELKFNEEMQRAKDEGRKTETRRVVELHADTYGGIEILGDTFITFDANGNELLHECPYGKIGYINNGCLITDIRAEKLHDISKESAIKEGVEVRHDLKYFDRNDMAGYRNYGELHPDGNPYWFGSPIDSFRTFWEFIYPNHPTKAWELNPYVWVITFEAIEL